MVRWRMVNGLRAAALAALLGACGARTATDPAGSSGGSGGDVDGHSACTRNSECIVVSVSCCGSCGTATRGDAIALNAARATEYRNTVCEIGEGCPPCYLPLDPTLTPTCTGGACRVVDLYEHPAASCSRDADCRVRTAACCECGGPTGPGELVAVRDAAAYARLVCDADQACPECQPFTPRDVQARCAGGHCIVIDSRTPS
jgi:hypothetical protein